VAGAFESIAGIEPGEPYYFILERSMLPLLSDCLILVQDVKALY